jgi:hypothetical protein
VVPVRAQPPGCCHHHAAHYAPISPHHFKLGLQGFCRPCMLHLLPTGAATKPRPLLVPAASCGCMLRVQLEMQTLLDTAGAWFRCVATITGVDAATSQTVAGLVTASGTWTINPDVDKWTDSTGTKFPGVVAPSTFSGTIGLSSPWIPTKPTLDKAYRRSWSPATTQCIFTANTLTHSDYVWVKTIQFPGVVSAAR